MDSPTPSWKVFLQGQPEEDEVIRGIIEGNRKAAGWVKQTKSLLKRITPQTSNQSAKPDAFVKELVCKDKTKTQSQLIPRIQDDGIG